MKHVFIILTLILSVNFLTISQIIPEGYILQYQQDFAGEKSLNDFRFSNPVCWKTAKENNNYYLTVHNCPADSFESINNSFAILDNFIFGDFILEASVLIPTNDSGQGKMNFLFGVRDSTHYYNLNLNTLPQGYRQELEIIEGNRPVVSVFNNTVLSDGKIQKWHKVRLERNIVEKTITFFFDDLKKPAFEVKDRSYIMGYIGFELNDGGKIYNVKIWSQTAIPQEAGFYQKKH